MKTYFSKRPLLSFGLLLLLAGVLATHEGRGRLLAPLDKKETSLDSEFEEPVDTFPLLALTVESKGIDSEYTQSSVEGCQAKTAGVRDMGPIDVGDYRKHSCVVNEHILYQIDQLKIEGCLWTETDKHKQRISALDQLKNEFVLKNISVLFRNDEMICEGVLQLPGADSVRVGGPCAVQKSSNFALVNRQRVESGADPLVAVFDLAAEKIPGIGIPKAHLVVTVSIPLTKVASDYLSYMLSNDAIEACDSALGRSNEQSIRL